MLRLLQLMFLCALLAGLILPIHVAAQTPTPGRSENDGLLSFTRLGSHEQTMRGPYDAAYLDFSLPATWELTSGAELQLNYNSFFAGESGRSFGGTIQVILNGVTLSTVLLDTSGEQSVRIPITNEALIPVGKDKRHNLSIILDTNEQCNRLDQTSVIIRPSSTLMLPHRVVAPPTALAQLPYPIAQRSFEPDLATLIIPDKPSIGELQAALTIAAGFGRMTGGKLDLSLTPISKLKDKNRDSTHLIMVGKPANLPLLREAKLPAALKGKGFEASDALPGDGIVQMTISPWNTSKVLLVASGDDDSAVIKAAQAVSTGTLRSSARPDLAVVALVEVPPIADTLSLDQTFADLGYGSQKMYGLGGQYVGYTFDIPPGMSVGQDAYLDLNFVHTALLDYDQSAVTVNLNDEPVASLRLDDNSTRLSSVRVALPAATLRPGNNQLALRGDLLPRAICTDPRGNGLWLAVRPESSLHLPLSPNDAQHTVRQIDLNQYPRPFITAPNLSGVAFVLGERDVAGWDVAARVAFNLGTHMQGALADLALAFADAVPEELRQKRDLLVVGQATALPVLQELAAVLPAPFAPGSTLASEPDVPVTYRLEPGTSLGYLELLVAPWNDKRSVLAVIGSTDEGLLWAGTALATPGMRGNLKGNLALIRGEQIESRDTRPAPGKLTPTPIPEATATAAQKKPSTVILVGIAVGGLVILGISVGLVMWWLRRRAKRRSTKQASSTKQTAQPEVEQTKSDEPMAEKRD